MPNVEIDEAEYLKMRQLGGVVHNIMKHPEARKFVERAHKLVDPNAATPTLDRDAAIVAPVSDLEKKFDAFVADTTKRENEREQNAKLNALKSQHAAGIAELRRTGWTEDGIKAVEKLMDEKGLLDPLDAAAIHEKAHPPSAVASPSGVGGWNFAEGIAAEDPLKKLLDTKGKNDLVVDKMASDVLNEFRQQMQPARR